LQRDADDFAFCLKEIGIDTANLIGWSDGGITAMCVAGNKKLASVVESMTVFGSNATLPEKGIDLNIFLINYFIEYIQS